MKFYSCTSKKNKNNKFKKKERKLTTWWKDYNLFPISKQKNKMKRRYMRKNSLYCTIICKPAGSERKIKNFFSIATWWKILLTHIYAAASLFSSLDKMRNRHDIETEHDEFSSFFFKYMMMRLWKRKIIFNVIKNKSNAYIG